MPDDGSTEVTFEVEVTCNAGGVSHAHVVTISSEGGEVVSATKPQNMRMQYVCPASGQPRIMTFKPPAGFARPYKVRSVN
jgi:hypothetical protein